MSISVDESSPAWQAFKTAERRKLPHFGVDFFDDNGQISGNSHLRVWHSEASQYIADRAKFIDSLKYNVSKEETQIQRPSPNIKGKTTSAALKQQHSSNKKALREEPKRSPPLPKASSSAMPRRTKRSQAWKGRRRGGKRRGGNKALASVKVPFKLVMEVDSKKSGAETGHWHNHLTIAELAGPSLKLHEEFKCCSMKVRFIPNDITTGAGLYAACLLDQNGFGDPAKPTTIWFPRVADLPGARIHNIMRGCAFSWHPTEPDSRNFRKSLGEESYVVASFYIFGNATDLSIKGQLLITGLLRARGEFYAANISNRIRALTLFNDVGCSSEEADEIESLE